MERWARTRFHDVMQQREKLYVRIRAIEARLMEEGNKKNPGHDLDKLIKYWDELKSRLYNINHTLELLGEH